MCMVWHEKHDSVRASSVASLKHGESMSPLYSRPDTRIMPSAQNEPVTNAGSRSTNAASAAGSRRAIGCGMKRVSRSSPPGRYGKPWLLARRSAPAS